MTALLLALCAIAGVHLLWTAFVAGRPAHAPGPVDRVPRVRRSSRAALEDWMAQAGLDGVDTRELAAVLLALAVTGALTGWVLFAGALPSLALAVLAVALFAAGIVILLFTIGTDLGRDFWARFGLHLLASWCLAGGVVLIASRSEELTPGATMLEA